MENASSIRLACQVSAHKSAVTQLFIHEHEGLVVSSGLDKCIRVLNLSTRLLVGGPIAKAAVLCFHLDVKKHRLFVGLKDTTILIFRVVELKSANFQYAHTISQGKEGHLGAILCMVADDYGRYLYTGGSNGDVCVWDCKKAGEEKYTMMIGRINKHGKKVRITGIAWTGDFEDNSSLTKHLIFTANNGQATIIDIGGGHAAVKSRKQTSTKGDLGCFYVRHAGLMICWGGKDKRVTGWGIADPIGLAPEAPMHGAPMHGAPVHHPPPAGSPYHPPVSSAVPPSQGAGGVGYGAIGADDIGYGAPVIPSQPQPPLGHPQPPQPQHHQSQPPMGHPQPPMGHQPYVPPSSGGYDQEVGYGMVGADAKAVTYGKQPKPASFDVGDFDDFGAF
eukprot:gnl/Carplike_NY0171/2145_a2885_483.p1 GENE.gnl/Carplike_NY0171/2145_a2885_483~~gnl/Carplike_NY0171/2145_a2885_483.p1  ORF type:complete len:390 (-),score=139.15 gnl/Carplike_NY0171/2145_a2885_483:144-1313(-)